MAGVTWAAYVVELLRLKAWTQAQLAEEVGVTQTTVSRWVKGDCDPAGSAKKALLRLGGQE